MWLTTARKAVTVWLGILVLAILNGLLREFALMPWLGTPAALLLSGAILAALILAVVYLTLPWLALHSPRQLWLLGVCWLAMTLAFEFSFGALQGKSWAELAAPYSFQNGNLWPLVLAVLLAAPFITDRLRRII